MTSTPDDPLAQLQPFVQAARWFGGKGREFTISGSRRLGEVPGHLPDGPRVAIDLVTLSYADSDDVEYYQLPLAFYEQHQTHLDHAFLGVWDDPDFGSCHVYDALHDRVAMHHWLRSFADPPEGPLVFYRLPGHDLDLDTHSTLFSGEQSNSSVAFGEDSLLKVFRKITPGVNPDVTVHEVLTRAGSDHVAALYGWLEAESLTGEPLHLAMLQQFLRTASDGWGLALASVRNLFAEEDLHPDEVGGDFAGEASRLGTALAETHETLREHFPVSVLDADAVTALADAMHERLTTALDIVPGLEPHAERLRATFDLVRRMRDVPVQQIHADLHLGQTLRTVRGWKIVDFEGEPAKPLVERQRPDSRWRDVAGMLRSFDYAPRVIEQSFDEHEEIDHERHERLAVEWSARNRDAFLNSYAGGRLSVDEEALLAAYVADKAVYEAVYETRNRPTWVAIPLAAIARIEV